MLFRCFSCCLSLNPTLENRNYDPPFWQRHLKVCRKLSDFRKNKIRSRESGPKWLSSSQLPRFFGPDISRTVRPIRNFETFSVCPIFGEVSLENKSNWHSHSKHSSQITTWTQFYSSIKMFALVSHISYLLADSESNPHFVAWGHALNCSRKKTGKPVKNACKSLGTNPWPAQNYSKNFHFKCFFKRIPFPIRFSRGMSFFAFFEELRAS